MALSIGIVGLPNVGKSTLFKTLTKKQVLIANYPFATIDPNIGVVLVPDERVDKLWEFSRQEARLAPNGAAKSALPAPQASRQAGTLDCPLPYFCCSSGLSPWTVDKEPGTAPS